MIKADFPGKLLDIISIRFRMFFLIMALLVLVVISSLLSPDFFKLSNLLNISVRISFLLVMSIGMTFVIISGGIDLSVVSVAILSHVIVAVILRDYGLSYTFVAIAAGLLSGVIVGAVNGLLVSRLKINAFIITMGMMAIARSVAELIAKGVVMGVPPEFSKVLGDGTIWIFPVLMVIALSIAAIAHIILSFSKFGTTIRGIGSNYEAAKYLGIRADRYKLLIFVVSGLLAGITGVMLVGRMGAANPGALAEGMELDAIAAPIIGGATFRGGEGTIIGTFIGAMIIGIIGNLVILLGVESYFQQVVSGLIIFGAVFLAYFGQKNV